MTHPFITPTQEYNGDIISIEFETREKNGMNGECTQYLNVICPWCSLLLTVPWKFENLKHSLLNIKIVLAVVVIVGGSWTDKGVDVALSNTVC